MQIFTKVCKCELICKCVFTFIYFFYNFKKEMSVSCLAGNGRICRDIFCEKLVATCKIGVCGYGYIYGWYPRKICGYLYGYGWEISYPRQAWLYGCQRFVIWLMWNSLNQLLLLLLTLCNTGLCRPTVNVKGKGQVLTGATYCSAATWVRSALQSWYWQLIPMVHYAAILCSRQRIVGSAVC